MISKNISSEVMNDQYEACASWVGEYEEYESRNSGSRGSDVRG
jgi:hypothetical protein